MERTEYTLTQMEQFLAMARGLYDVVRLVDPVECREIIIEDGHLKFLEGCYHVWDSGKRCKNCSSYKACRSGDRREKQEFYEGNVFNILSNPVKLIAQDGTVIDCVIELITAHKAEENEQANVNDRRSEENDPPALLDTLTGVNNWDGFHQKARAFVDAHPKDVCVIGAFDISHFKLVNSLFGRAKGDDILIHVASILRRVLQGDVVIGRIQADQFAVCMLKEKWDESDITEELSGINDMLDKSAFALEIFAGVYEITDRQLPIATMYDRAVMAYISGYSAKERKLITWFDESMMEELLYQQEVTSGFEKNLAAGEFQIYLQPQVDEKGQMYGGEALCRWIRPKEGIVPPYKFIPIFEKSGQIARLDCHVWELAAAQLAKWVGTEYDGLYISVNISPLDFYYIDVYGTLTDIVGKYGIDRKKLKLEITETAIMSDVEK